MANKSLNDAFAFIASRKAGLGEGRMVEISSGQGSGHDKIRAAWLKFGDIHSKIQFDGCGMGFAKHAKDIGKIKDGLVLHQFRLADSGQVFGPLNGCIEVAGLVYET